MENELATNKNAGALLRDAELELVKHPVMPIDLKHFARWNPDRTLVASDLKDFIGYDVTIPDTVAKAVHKHVAEGSERGFFQKSAVHRLEKAVEDYHGVKPPYYIAMSITLQQTGRPWAYVPEAGVFLTGFTLGKHE